MASRLTSENLAAKDGKVTNRLSCGNHGPHTPAGSMARWNVHGQHGEREKRLMLGRSTPVTSYSGPPRARIAVIEVSGGIVMVVIAAGIWMLTTGALISPKLELPQVNGGAVMRRPNQSFQSFQPCYPFFLSFFLSFSSVFFFFFFLVSTGVFDTSDWSSARLLSVSF